LDVFEVRGREIPITKVCETVEASRSTFYRYMTPDGVPRQGRNATSVGSERKSSNGSWGYR